MILCSTSKGFKQVGLVALRYKLSLKLMGLSDSNTMITCTLKGRISRAIKLRSKLMRMMGS